MKSKSLYQWLEYLESIHPKEIEMGLNRVRTVAQRMDLIKPASKVMLVAGTNGKGSTVTYCSTILSQCGLLVGSYMSPHLHVYNERVRINNKMASDLDLVESFEAIEIARQDITLTYFEFGTLSSLYIFKKYKVDCAVIEVGLGGRLDATNIVDPDVSVVTSVGLDHQDWLGDDLDQIAYEKAGVFRSGKMAVCGEEGVSSRLIEHAESIGANLLIKNTDYSVTSDGSKWSWKGKSLDNKDVAFDSIDLPNLPLENAGTALQAILAIYPQLTLSQINQGLALAKLPGRMQRFEQPFSGLLDVGHNPQAAKLVATQWKKSPVKGRRFALLAMLSDKDAVNVVSELKDTVDVWHLAGLDGFRGQTVDELNTKVSSIVSIAGLHKGVAEALEYLKNELQDGDEILILGSFITVANAQIWLEGCQHG